jgi:hypothetical protein
MMYVLAILGIGFAAYGAFDKTRAGTDPARAIIDAVLFAGLFAGIISAGSSCLSGEGLLVFADFALTLFALSFTAALLGAFLGHLKPRREPLPHW